MKQKKEVGRPQKYKEETEVYSERVPKSEKDNIKKIVREYLIKLEK
jgi:hypothetical protein